MDGWRILNIEEDSSGDDIITLISAGIPLRYNFSRYARIDDIVTALTTDFENTEFERIKPGSTSEVQKVNGSEFLNSLYAESVTGFTYEMLSDLIYGNKDYISVSYNEGFDTSTTVSKNTLDESNNRFIINDWNDAKEKLVDVGASYILGSKTADDKSISVYYDSAKNHLTTSTNKTSIGVRVVVKIKKTSPIIGGSGTKADPYTLKSEGSSDVGLFKIGDYVTYEDIWNYDNVGKQQDIDDSKKLNDSFGHDFGDEVLRGVAQLLLMNERHNVKCYRYGGEEMVIILEHIDLEHAVKFSERIRTEISLLRWRENVRVTASFGLGYEMPDSVKEADENMYLAKKKGKNFTAYRKDGKQYLAERRMDIRNPVPDKF